MTNLEKMKTGTRKVNSCSVNSLVFAGFQGQNTGNTPNANTTDNNNNNNYVVGNSNRKRPYSVGFTGGLLPLCAPSCADESAPTTGGNATAGSGVNVGSGLGVGVGCGTTCYDPHRAISSYPRLQPSRQRVNNITAAPAPPRQNRHRQNRRTDVDNPRSRSAPNLNAPNVGRCHAPSTVHVGLDALDKRPCDKSSNPTSSSSTSYCWLTDTDIRSNRTKEAAGRFYKHTYGTGSCNSIKVNFPAAGTFVDNHKLNSKLRGYMQWSESSKTLTGSKLLERLHYLSSEKRPPSCENTASAINSLQNKNCLISEDNSGCLYTKVSQSIGIFKKMPDSRAKKAGRFKGNQDDAELLQLVAGCNVLSANNQKSQNEVSPPTSVQNQSRSQRPITKKELSISVPYS